MTDQQLKRVFNELRRRGARRLLQRFLGEHELTSARSWQELEERVRDHIADGSLDEDEFKDFFIQLQATAYKSYSLYELSAKERKALVSHFRNLTLKNEFVASYPIPITRSGLENASTDPVPVALYDSTEGTALVLCSARSFMARKPVPPEHIAKSARDEYIGATLFADQVGLFQAFDIVFVSKDSDYIQVRTDVGEDRLEEDVLVLQAGVTDALTDIIQDGGISDLPSPIDLFPAVRSIFEDKAEGRIAELYFDCTTGANRRETMKRKAAGDLRNESYHVAGKKTTKILPYRVTVAWTSKGDGREEYEIDAHLPGTLRMLNGNGELHTCYLPGLPREAEVDFMLGRILYHAQK